MELKSQNPTPPPLSAAAQAANAAALAKQMDPAATTVINDLNTNNFAGAWQTALATSPLYNTNYTNPTTDPLLEALESSTGLKELDPSKQWTTAETDSYYQALAANPVYQGKTVAGDSSTTGNTESLGQDPYGTWGSAAAIKSGSDASANLSQEGGTPDVERFAGAEPDKNFLEKYGADIGALALTVATMGAGAGAGAAIVGADTAATIGATATTVIGDAAIGAGIGGLEGAVTGGNIGEDMLLGAVGGAATGATPFLSSELSTATGLNSLESGAIVGAGTHAATGALGAELTGGNVGKSAETGAVTGAITGAIQGSGVKGALGSTIGTPAAGLVTGLATSELTGLATSGITSPSGSGATGPSPAGASVSTPADQIQPSLATPSTPATAPTSLGSSIGGALGSLIPSAGTAAGMAPYLAVGAIGLEQANAGETQAANYSATQQKLAQPAISQSNTLLGNYNSGTINPVDQAASSTQIAQGQAINSNPNLASLSSIAQTAFANYNSGKLNAADQTQLDQSTAAAKQQVASQLAAAGITDSSILSQQYQQIDNNAQIQKQTLLNGYFNTGNQAYNQWLTTTEAGNAAIVAGQKIASDSLQTELANSMAEANIGIGEMNTAISTQMQTDAEYAAQVSQLMGTLATAYAKSVASTSSGTSGGGSGAGNAATNAAAAAAKAATGSNPAASSVTPPPTGAAGAGLYSQGATTGDNSLANEAQPDLNMPDPAPLNIESDTGASSTYMDSAFSQDGTDLSNLFGSVD